ncbi:fibronectin type III domain-containing protein [Persephonella sp.]
MRKIYKLFILTVAIMFISCGLKSSPLPPLSDEPAPVTKLNLKQQGDRFVIFWRYDGVYEDGRKMKEFRFDIFTLDGKINREVERQGRIYWTYYRINSFDREYCFKIRVFNGKEYSKFSRYVCKYPEKVFPDKVYDLKIQMEEGKLILSWFSEENSFKIYRSNKSVIPPIEYAEVKNTSTFVDRRLSYGKKYCYYITAYNGKVEGNPSQTVCKVYRDIFPPEPPKNPELIKKGEDYIIIWTESPSKDVAGYLIFKNGKPLIKTPIKTYFFIDRSYQKGDRYYIIAVDRAGNKSEPAYLTVE